MEAEALRLQPKGKAKRFIGAMAVLTPKPIAQTESRKVGVLVRTVNSATDCVRKFLANVGDTPVNSDMKEEVEACTLNLKNKTKKVVLQFQKAYADPMEFAYVKEAPRLTFEKWLKDFGLRDAPVNINTPFALRAVASEWLEATVFISELMLVQFLQNPKRKGYSCRGKRRPKTRRGMVHFVRRPPPREKLRTGELWIQSVQVLRAASSAHDSMSDVGVTIALIRIQQQLGAMSERQTKQEAELKGLMRRREFVKDGVENLEDVDVDIPSDSNDEMLLTDDNDSKSAAALRKKKAAKKGVKKSS